MKLHSRLSLLVAAALAPMIVFGVLAAVLLQKDERDTMARDGIGRARSAMSAVDSHLRGTLLALRALAASKNLETGNLAAFHAETQRVLQGDPAWVNIGLICKNQVLFNAVYALGKPEPMPPNDDAMSATADGTRLSYGSVRTGNVVRNPTVRVHLPITYGSELYILAAPLNLKHIAEVLQAQKLPESWTITLLDRNRNVIAALPAMPAGSPVPDNMREAVERSSEGWARGEAADPQSVYIAHVTSEMSGWILAIGIPPAYLEGGTRRSFTALTLGALLALALGIGLAWLVARRIPG